MSKSKKLFLILCAAMISFFTGCDNNLFKKNGQIVFDFSGLANSGKTNSRNAIEDILKEGKDCFIDLALEGTFTYSDTFNLKGRTSYTIDGIPIGSQIKAIIQVYTLDDKNAKEVLFSGQSKNYLISEGTTQIVVHLNKPQTQIEIDNPNGGQGGGGNSGGGGQQQEEDNKITIFVRYDSSYQGNYWNTDENKSNEPSENDGKTRDTGFYYLQSAVNWIAENGNYNKDYEIMLINTNTFDQDVYASPEHTYQASIIFGETEATADNLNGRANSITLTSTNPELSAIKANHGVDNVLIRTSVPLYFKDIKIETENHSRILDIEYGISANVFLKSGTVFTDSSTNQTRGSSAIWMEYGTVTMQDNAIIEKFNSSNGGAVYMKYGSFIMEDNSRIQNCKSSEQGGAIYMHNTSDSIPSFKLSGDAVIYNCSSKDGGAIYQYGGSSTIESGSIIECTATQYGGAVYMDGYYKNIKLNLKGGTIKDNEAQKGSAIYLTKTDGTASLILSDDACIDLSNDIYSPGIPIKIGSTLSTPKGKAALITFSSFSQGNSIVTIAGNASANDIRNSCSKFFVNENNSETDYYVDQSGKLQKFIAGNCYLASDAEVWVGDIVLADSKRLRGSDFYMLSQNLYNTIAGIVFYASTDSHDSLGAKYLIAGTKTYEGNFVDTYFTGTSVYPHFDITNIINFDYYSNNYINPEELYNPTTSSLPYKNSYVNFDDVGIVRAKDTDTHQIIYSDENLFERILNGEFPLSKLVFEYGHETKFSNTLCKYQCESTDDIDKNWYIPTIEEYYEFAYALFAGNFKSIYMAISNSTLTGDYISSSMMWSTGTKPPSYQIFQQEKYYPYNFGINFENETIIQKTTPEYDTLPDKAIPIHVYDPEWAQN